MRHSLSALSGLSLLRSMLPAVRQREYKPRDSISREDFRKRGREVLEKELRERERERDWCYMGTYAKTQQQWLTAYKLSGREKLTTSHISL